MSDHTILWATARLCHPQKLLISFCAKAKLLQWLSKASPCLLSLTFSHSTPSPTLSWCPGLLLFPEYMEQGLWTRCYLCLKWGLPDCPWPDASFHFALCSDVTFSRRFTLTIRFITIFCPVCLLLCPQLLLSLFSLPTRLITSNVSHILFIYQVYYHCLSLLWECDSWAEILVLFTDTAPGPHAGH